MARKKRVVIPNRCYHLVSRVAHQAFFFDDEEKDRFVEFMHRAASFSGVRLLGWCILSNHFHILIYLPEEEPLTDEQLLDRVRALYRGPQLVVALSEWESFRKESESEAAADVTHGSRFDDLKNRLRARMFHPGEFMKTLKQYVTTSFNGRRSHVGTLWENRYKVRISKPHVRDVRAQLAYVDCNPCEAGICRNPADYPWSGWHAAVCGDMAAREMYRFVYCEMGSSQEDGKSETAWEEIVEIHEQAMRERIGEISESKAAGEETDWMFAAKEDNGELCTPKKREVMLNRGRGSTAERILSVVRAAGELSAGEILEAVGIASRPFLLMVYLKPMVAQGLLALAIPEKPSSRHQKYRIGVRPQCIGSSV